MKKRPATLDELKKIADKYLEGKSLRQSAKIFGYNQGISAKALKIFNITPRTRSQALRKYAVDETFFEKIDTEEKAYWLGFISADGNISKNGYILSIGLKSTDVKHLEKFKKDIKAEHKISIRDIYDKKTKKWKKQASIYICSKKICGDLIKLGVVPAKSLILKPCLSISKYFQKHYWRGFVDGDGWISFHKKSKQWNIGVIGTYDICKIFHLFLSEKIDIKEKKPKQEGKVYNIEYRGNVLLKKICLFLYKNSSIYLNRKYKLAKTIFEKSDLLLSKSLRSLKSDGFNFNKLANKFQSHIKYNKKSIFLGTYKTPQQAFIANKSAWYKIYVEKCQNSDTIKQYAKQSAQNPVKWIEEMTLNPDLKEVMDNFIIPAYSKL